jgi:ATP-dependent Clp protease protease subunit
MQAADAEKPITVYINSFGGCWFNGFAVYDIIKACPATVTAYVVGSAMSMGSLILQAADHRVIYPNATVMVHDGSWNVEDTVQSFHNWAEFSKKAQQQMYGIYAGRSGRPPSFWKKKCAADLILSAKEAKELGLVDEILGT